MAELYLFNKEEVLINIIPEDEFNNDSHVREINSTWSFEFATTFQYLNDLSKSNKVGFYDRYRKFRLFKIIKEPEVDYLSDEVVVNCLNDCYEMSDQIIEDKRLRDGTARQALDKVLEGSNYEVGEVAGLGNRTINFYDISRMEGLNNIIKSYGGELDYRIEFDTDFKRISHKYVDIKSRLGQDTGLRFTYDLNLESVVRKDVSESHCTVLYGRGRAIESGDGYSRKIKFTDVEWKKPTNQIDKPIGQNYIEDLDAIAKYGRIEGIYENSDIEEPCELLQATYEALQECKNPKLSYEVNAKDLASQNNDYDHLTVVLGDSVILLDEDYDLNLESRIVGFEESIKEESAEMKWMIGNVQSSYSSDNASSGQIIKPSTGNVDIEIDDDKFPDELPDVPMIEAEGLFGSVIISWTYESKSYYEYELYASKLENFNPDTSDLIFRGKASSYHHQVKPSETWYYRARTINTHGRATDFSSQVQASTLKIEDGTEYFEKAAIADALIGELRLDRGWVGKLKGNRIDARELFVTDGNGKKTLEIDSFGSVSLDILRVAIKTLNGAYTVFDNSGMNSYDNEGHQTLGIRNGGLTFHAWNNNEYVGYISQSAIESTGRNGVALGITPNAEYLSLGVSSRTDANDGFSQTSYFAIASSDQNTNGDNYTKGINFYQNVDAHGWNFNNVSTLTASGSVNLKGNAGVYFDHGTSYSSAIWEDTSSGNLAVFGDNGVVLGYKNGATNTNILKIMEKADSSSCKINTYENWNFNNWHLKKCKLRYDGFSRTSADSVTFFQANLNGESHMNVELANDYVTYFNIQANNYVDGGRYIARFNYANGNASNNVGIRFYRALDMNNYNISNVGNMNVYSLGSEEVVTNDIKIVSPYAVMSRNGKQSSMSVIKGIDDVVEHTATVKVSRRSEVDLPLGLINQGYEVLVSPYSLARVAVTERNEEYFVIETDTDEEIEVVYNIKAFQPKYVTRLAAYGELQGEESTQAMTSDEVEGAVASDENCENEIMTLLEGDTLNI